MKSLNNIFQWALDKGLQTLEVRVFHKHKNFRGIQTKTPMWKCRFMALDGNNWKQHEYVSETLEGLESQMSKVMKAKVAELPSVMFDEEAFEESVDESSEDKDDDGEDFL